MRYRGCKPAKKVGQGFYWRLADVVAWRAKNLHAEPSGPGAERAGAKGEPRAGSRPVPRGTPPGMATGDEEEDGEESGTGFGGDEGKPDTVIEADLRLKHARTQLARLELRKRAEELVPVQEVREAWSRRVSAAKRLLESLAPAVAQDVCAACALGADVAPKIERAVGDAFAQTLQRLADTRGEAT